MKSKLYSINDSTTTIDISALGLESADDYFVIINGLMATTSSSGANAGWGDGAVLTSKTATSFTVTVTGGSTGITGSAQVVYNA